MTKITKLTLLVMPHLVTGTITVRHDRRRYEVLTNLTEANEVEQWASGHIPREVFVATFPVAKQLLVEGILLQQHIKGVP
jgi:hypothetical protein